MKFNVHPESLALGAAGGLAAGALCGVLVARAFVRRTIDSEVAAVKAHYNDQLKVVVGKLADETRLREAAVAAAGRAADDGSDAGGDADAADSDDGLGELPPEGEGDLPDEAAADRLKPSVPVTTRRAERTQYSRVAVQPKPSLEELQPTVASGPYVVTAESFFEDHNDDHQKLTITYYSGDKVLVDDKDVPIREVGATIGDATGRFGQDSNDENIVYVRNDKLEIDFEVTLDHRSYAEVVLGYGNPSKAKK